MQNEKGIVYVDVGSIALQAKLLSEKKKDIWLEKRSIKIMKKLLPRGVLAYAMHILHTIYFLLGGYQYGHKGWYYEAAE